MKNKSFFQILNEEIKNSVKRENVVGSSYQMGDYGKHHVPIDAKPVTPAETQLALKLNELANQLRVLKSVNIEDPNRIVDLVAQSLPDTEFQELRGILIGYIQGTDSDLTSI
jgi:hypothetical protein